MADADERAEVACRLEGERLRFGAVEYDWAVESHAHGRGVSLPAFDRPKPARRRKEK